jgi:exonuclease SbcC
VKLERLLVRGLRSYVSETEIDLARLGEQGLFAIFGPTGSGKSTILDGIFLAFFGSCPRGEAGDCVSAGAFELAVRLEIDASLDDAPRPLAIERRFRWSKKRDPAAGANGPEQRGAPKHLPLRIEERKGGAWSAVDTGGHKPEDYLRDRIVRISMSDFQQAVVLPQGEFGALLSARPAERRTLVASLFRTEHLGQPLFDALRAREVEVRDELDRLEHAERAALVAPEAIEAAEERAAIARAAARHSAAEAATIELDQARIAVVAAEARAAATARAELIAAVDRHAASDARVAATAARVALVRGVLEQLDRAGQGVALDVTALVAQHEAVARLEAASRAREEDARAVETGLALDAREAWARHDEARARCLRAEAAVRAEAARGDALERAERAAQDLARREERDRRAARTLELRARAALLEPRARRLAQARQLVSASQLAELAAERHLEAVTRGAAVLLRSLSADRYALVRAADGAFAVADSALSGLVRSSSTLSGGETFLVSLALALALSERIQLAGGARFDFFFLDEGFGGLDAVTLEAAITALERLCGPHRVIGMISHLPAIEERMPRKLRVESERPGGHTTVLHEDGLDSGGK